MATYDLRAVYVPAEDLLAGDVLDAGEIESIQDEGGGEYTIDLKRKDGSPFQMGDPILLINAAKGMIRIWI